MSQAQLAKLSCTFHSEPVCGMQITPVTAQDLNASITGATIKECTINPVQLQPASHGHWYHCRGLQAGGVLSDH
jgi:hypothetical protein